MRPPRRGSVMALGRFTLSAICTSSNAEPAHLSVQLRVFSRSHWAAPSLPEILPLAAFNA